VRASFSVIPVFLLLASTAGGQQTRSVTADIADEVRATYDGESAFETVAFLDQYVRWPGNRGFDASIDHIAARLESFGYVAENHAPDNARLTYRVEEYPMDERGWEPLTAAVTIVGEDVPLLSLTTNRNMLATRSNSTSIDGVTAELVYAGYGPNVELDAADVAGKIVLAEGDLSAVFQAAVVESGAAGVLVYELPAYLQPSKNKHSIQFRGLRDDVGEHDSWAIALSFAAHEHLQEKLAQGQVDVNVETSVHWTENAVERTVVADVHGSVKPDERFVFSAHVQEPGANDNASGVGAQLEMARVAAKLVRDGKADAKRSVTFLWGDEIVSTRRYVTQDQDRAAGIRWGLSVDMVGEDTEKTGGTFLIEKMPDPSAIWTRGEDKHSEWGGEPLNKEDMTPHYFNDLAIGRALEQAATNGWVVKTNPFEGGSDHVPFLRAEIPGLLFWHFTDQFYHTDRDRLEMVSADELKNSGVSALVTSLAMAGADSEMAIGLIEEVRQAAIARLAAESKLSIAAIAGGANASEQRDIVSTWADWYDDALASMDDIEVGGSSVQTVAAIEESREAVRASAAMHLNNLE
jgi:aminopeptidase YwaD